MNQIKIGKFIPKKVWRIAVVFGICVIFFISCFCALKFEVNNGTYKCKNCSYETVPTYSEALCAMHIGSTRYLKCSKCNKRTWHKKILHK